MSGKETVISIRWDDTELSGIGITRARAGQHKRLVQIQDRSGYIVRGKEIETWRWQATVEQEGLLYALFPGAEDLEPLGAVADRPPEKALALAEEFLYAYHLLRDKAGSKDITRVNQLEIIPEAVFFDREGNWYFLPEALAGIIEEEKPEEKEPRDYSSGKKEAKLLKTLILSLYRSLTGHGPYDEDAEAPAHPHLYRPDLRREYADLLFSPTNPEIMPDTEEASRILSFCRREGIFLETGEEERERIRRQAGESLEKESRRRKRARTVQKYGPPTALGIAAVLVLLFLFVPMRRSSQKDDPTAGLGPEEVIRLYYRSINSLDHETMDDCTIGNTGSLHTNEVTTLFVISRVRKGVENTDSFMSVREWEEKNRPPLPNNIFVYGTNVLDIRKNTAAAKNAETEQFVVEYLKYSTLPAERSGDEEQIDSTGIVEIQEVREELVLERQRSGDWKIASLRPLQKKLRERVSPP